MGYSKETAFAFSSLGEIVIGTKTGGCFYYPLFFKSLKTKRMKPEKKNEPAADEITVLYADIMNQVMQCSLRCESAGSFVENKVVSFSEIYFFSNSIKKVFSYLENNDNSAVNSPKLEKMIHEMRSLNKEITDSVNDHLRHKLLSLHYNVKNENSIHFRYSIHGNEVYLYNDNYPNPADASLNQTSPALITRRAVLKYINEEQRYSLSTDDAMYIKAEQLSKEDEMKLVQYIFHLVFSLGLK